MDDEEFDYPFDPMFDLRARWGITLEEAEVFLEESGYFATYWYRELADDSTLPVPDNPIYRS